MYKCFFSLLLSFYAVFGVAQKQEPPQEGSQGNKPKQTMADSESFKPKPDWTPHELKVGFNAIRSGRTAFGAGITTHEIQAGLAMHQAIAVLDLGIEENIRGQSFDYVNKGRYFRVGADWNLVKDLESGNVMSLGLRYARAGFEDNLAYSRDMGFGEENYQFANSSLNARWFEVTFNLRGKIVSNLYMGFTLRWQTIRKINGEGELKAFDIPGFGKTRRENSTAFDYYFMWRLPLKKK